MNPARRTKKKPGITHVELINNQYDLKRVLLSVGGKTGPTFRRNYTEKVGKITETFLRDITFWDRREKNL
jgi:hypothetical protein